MPDPITAAEIDAYIDDALDPARRLAVEEHLARSPDDAARLMADLGLRTALRLTQSELPAPSSELSAAADRLFARLGEPRKPFGNLFARHRRFGAGTALAALLVGVVMLPHTSNADASPPLYVADAVEAFQTGLLRASMPSQAESTVFDSRDVRRFTQIRVPRLPDGWTITDVQIFPSDAGPALQIMVRTDIRQTVSLFAVRSPAPAPLKPAVVHRGDATVAYWRNGDIAYALTGAEAPEALDLAARDLADNRLD
jgi:anti-sigma factor RsiW